MESVGCYIYNNDGGSDRNATVTNVVGNMDKTYSYSDNIIHNHNNVKWGKNLVPLLLLVLIYDQQLAQPDVIVFLRYGLVDVS